MSDESRCFLYNFKYFSDVRIYPIWTSRTDLNISIADMGSKAIPTDEWGLSDYAKVTHKLNIVPSVDAFASESNSKCKKFFSRLPSKKSCGTNFFIQDLVPSECYYACPPPKLIARTWLNVTSTPNLKVLLVVPLWYSHSYMALLKTKDGFHKLISRHCIFKAEFDQSHNSIFCHSSKFYMLAVVIET